MMLPETRVVELDDLKDLLDKDKPLFFDTETNGLYGTIQLAQFYQEHLDIVYFVSNPKALYLGLFLQDYFVVGHNLTYDFTCIQRQANNTSMFLDIKMFDTFYASRVFWPGEESYSLKAIHEKVHPYNVYAEFDVDVKLAKKVHSWDVNNEQERLYCALDVFVLVKLYNTLKGINEKDHALYNIYKLDVRTMLIALDFQPHGYPFLMDRVFKRLEEIREELKNTGLPNHINSNSVKQVKEFLNVQETSKKHLMVALVEIFEEKDKPKVLSVLKDRSLKKEKTFLINWAEKQEPIVYGHLAPNTRGGRFNSANDNLQQIPRRFYHMFGLPKDNEEDEVVIYSDYSQLELRTFAAVVGDTKMAQAFKDGVDVHTLTTQEMFGVVEPTDEQRFLGKCCNFLLLYGGGAEVLFVSVLESGKFVITREQAQEFHTKFLNKAWPKVRDYKNRGIRDLKKKVIWHTVLGRPYIGKRLTDHLNTKVQGSGADIAKLAMHYMYTEPKFFEKYNVKIRNFIHDAYVLTCKKEGYKEVAEFVGSCMLKGWEQACKVETPGRAVIQDIPMPIDVLVGYSVGDMKKDYIAKLDIINHENKWSYPND